MIESAEIKQLSDYSAKPFQNQSIIEFGCFMGKSTLAMAKSLQNNNTPLCIVDGFRTEVKSSFSKHVNSACSFYSLKPEIIKHCGKEFIDFKKSFETVMKSIGGKYLNFNSFYYREDYVAGLIHDFHLAQNVSSIGLLHIDLAKNWQQLSSIISSCSPYIIKGTNIIFQDFYYHWSSSIIQGIALLEWQGYIEFKSTAASSMACEVLKPIDTNILMSISHDLEEKDNQKKLWSYIFKTCGDTNKYVHHYSGIDDMKKRFFYRLKLAYIMNQLLLYKKQSKEDDFKKLVGKLILDSTNSESQYVLNDTIDLISSNFDINTQSWI